MAHIEAAANTTRTYGRRHLRTGCYDKLSLPEAGPETALRGARVPGRMGVQEQGSVPRGKCAVAPPSTVKVRKVVFA